MFVSLVQSVQNRFLEKLSQGYHPVVLKFSDEEREQLWNLYLSCYPEVERQFYNCKACRNFITAFGGTLLVNVVDKKLVKESIWEVSSYEDFHGIGQKLSEFVLSRISFDSTKYGLLSPTRPNTHAAGIPQNITLKGDVWNHFHLQHSSIDKHLDGAVLVSAVLTRKCLSYLKASVIQTVESLLPRLNRSETVRVFLRDHKGKGLLFDSFSQVDRTLFSWFLFLSERPSSRLALSSFANSSLGALLFKPLSQGEDVEVTLRKYNSSTSPENYARTSALPSNTQVAAAQAFLDEKGITAETLKRSLSDSQSFASRYFREMLYTRPPQNVLALDSLLRQIQVKAPLINVSPSFKRESLPSISLSSILSLKNPDIFLFLTSEEKGKMFVFTERDTQAGNEKILKTHDDLSWHFAGGYAGEVQARVKARGGNLNAPIVFSLGWDSGCDLDAHAYSTSGCTTFHTYFRQKRTEVQGNPFRAVLDVDANVSTAEPDAAENICITPFDEDGSYKFKVENFTSRRVGPPGFNVRLKIFDQVFNLRYEGYVTTPITVASFDISGGKIENLKLNIPEVPENIASLWGLPVHTFVPVQAICHSPNYWREHQSGNKLTMFLLDGIRPAEKITPFFSELLTSDLWPYRRVLEQLANSLLIDPSEYKNPAGGVGVEASKVVLKVDGKLYLFDPSL